MTAAKFSNHYRCPTCKHEWADEWDCTCDDDCPQCGTRHISPYESTDLEPKPTLYAVSIMLVDRAYGGPEEGGWWYEHGAPIDYIPDGINPHDLVTIFPPDSEAEAKSWRDTLQCKLDASINKGRRGIGSVLSEGRFHAVLQPHLPRAYPATRPHYE